VAIIKTNIRISSLYNNIRSKLVEQVYRDNHTKSIRIYNQLNCKSSEISIFSCFIFYFLSCFQILMRFSFIGRSHAYTHATAVLLVCRRISITRIDKRIHQHRWPSNHRWSCFLLILFWFIRLCCCCCFLLYSLNVRKLRSCARWNLHLCVYFDQFKHKWCRSRALEGAANICRAHSSSYRNKTHNDVEIKMITSVHWPHKFEKEKFLHLFVPHCVSTFISSW
jgi:hypothetical protein